MDTFSFWNGHACEGLEQDVAELLNNMVLAARAKPECLDVRFFRSVLDRRRFMVPARWRDESFFEAHMKSPEFVVAVDRLQRLLTGPGNVTVMRCIGGMENVGQQTGVGTAEEVFVFHNFQARPGNEELVGSILREGATKVRAEPGCHSLRVFQSLRDPGIYLIHSRWRDGESLEALRKLPYLTAYSDKIRPMIHYDFDITLMHQLG